MKRMEEKKTMAVVQAIKVEMFNGKFTALCEELDSEDEEFAAVRGRNKFAFEEVSQLQVTSLLVSGFLEKICCSWWGI
jgi:hypothetical protein